MRLALSFAATLAVVGVAGYAYMDHELRAAQISSLAADHRSDAKTFELYGARSGTRAQATVHIGQVMDGISRREGTLETLLIAPDGAIRASGEDPLVGARLTDVRIEAALRHGASYAGPETATNRNHANFEFVTPVILRGERYAFAVSYDHKVLDAQLSDVRQGLVLVGLLALLVFYLFGGRALLRSTAQTIRNLVAKPGRSTHRNELGLRVFAGD